MNSDLLFTIYRNARNYKRDEIALPDIKPEYKIVDIKPIRKHTNFHSFG